ncbi:hypothetical protein [Pseudactinotalea sp. Z1748]|uniref:hypothetical protein n=1 Tax=Pseudactinotalea sp. Z1748 TaxID=3413027 RepID=UPI003C7BBE43
MADSQQLVLSSRAPLRSRRDRAEDRKELHRVRKELRPDKHRVEAEREAREFTFSKMPRGGWKLDQNLRGRTRVDPPAHRASSKTLGAAYPFLTESGEILRGPYIGENMLSRSPFCFDMWDAYDDGVIKSHSVAILGVKGSGKSMLAKSWASRLALMGRHIAVPHDPNAEWSKVAAYVGGKTVAVGPGIDAKVNLLDPGTPDESLTAQAWRAQVLADRRATLKAVVNLLRKTIDLAPEEHTALDDALADLDTNATVTVVDAFHKLREHSKDPDEDIAHASRRLAHTLRRLVAGDLAGPFDGPSTIRFDPTAPIMTVDTSRLKNANPEMQALSRLATSAWVRNATSGSNRGKRVVVHEEAAIALMNEVHGGSGLKDRVADEKTARHAGTSNWYLLHRIADLDALGDEGSAMQTQARGLLADCETRVSYQQHAGEIARSSRMLGWNRTMGDVVRKLGKGQGLWQIGPDRLAMVRNKLTDLEYDTFRTDAQGGPR